MRLTQPLIKGQRKEYFMAFDALVLNAVATELNQCLQQGRIEKIYQPEQEELLFHIRTKSGNLKLSLSATSSGAGVYLVSKSLENPASPMAFCMLLRKHLQGGRILQVNQRGWERILEFEIEGLGELGFPVKKRLVVEIMGKHSNIVLIDPETDKVLDCIKRISMDQNRVRQLLPGRIYEYPPLQNKTPISQITPEQIGDILKMEGELKLNLLNAVQGISPQVAQHLSYLGLKEPGSDTKESQDLQYTAEVIYKEIQNISKILKGEIALAPTIYLKEGRPFDFHVLPLGHMIQAHETLSFESVSSMLETYYTTKDSSSRLKQKTQDLERNIHTIVQKLYLKKQRLSEDILKAENSEEKRLYGELLTANLHTFQTGDKSVTVLNYYDNSQVEIPLDIRLSPGKNAQSYFKKYAKAKTAIKEKHIQLEEVDREILYLESLVEFLKMATTIDETEEIRNELIDGGFLRRRKNSFQTKKQKPAPYRYKLSHDFEALAGRNNKENDLITFKTAGSKDLWFHTKDIPGSHVILLTKGQSIENLPPEVIIQAAGIAAYHSKGRDSENVPVDYTLVRHVKKPNGARPGMVIFTHNKTLFVSPAQGKEV